MSDLVSPFNHLSHETRLSRRYYPQSAHMATWLLNHVGPGFAFELVSLQGEPMWMMDRMFGMVTIKFQHEADLVQFKLTWHV